MADRPYDRQNIRFFQKGVNLSTPRELVPPDQYARFTNVIANQNGTLQTCPGATSVIIAGGGGKVTNVRRLTRYRTNETIWVYSSDGGVINTATGAFPAVQIVPGPDNFGFSADPATFVAYRTFLTGEPYMYVGDALKNVKVNIAGAITKMGILRPLTGAIVAGVQAGTLSGDYDWRYTYYNSNTGAESNPNNTGTAGTLTSQDGVLTIAASPVNPGDPAVPAGQLGTSTDSQVTHIRIYRRGGTLTDTWLRVTQLTNTAQTYVDGNADEDIASATPLDIDNDVPVTSVNASGTTLVDATAVPLPYIWGPVDDTLFGCGDPNRPAEVYFSKKAMPESWPTDNHQPTDAASRAVNGFAYDGKSYVFTRDDLYAMIPNLIEGQTWTPIKTVCGKGIVGPYAFCVGPRVWFCYEDGVYETTGTTEAKKVSDFIRPLFPFESSAGYTYNGYNPVHLGDGIADLKSIRMAYHNNEVWLFYQEIYKPTALDRLHSKWPFAEATGDRRAAVYNWETGAWRFLGTANSGVFGYSDEAPQSSFLMGMPNGDVYVLQSGDHNGSAISAEFETGGHDQGLPRADKQYGDAAVWCDCAGGSIVVGVYLNSSNTASLTTTLTGNGLRRYVIPINGRYGRHISFRFNWAADDTIQPIFHWIEVTYLALPEEIVARQTDWDDLGHPGDKLVKGVVFRADTKGNVIRLRAVAQHDPNNVYAEFTAWTASGDAGPRTLHQGFPSFRAREVRLVPVSTDEWKFYGVVNWLFDPEPLGLGFHEVYWGDCGYPHDKLIKGVTVEASSGVGAAQTCLYDIIDDQGVVRQTITLTPRVEPQIEEFSWAAFRTRNVRIRQNLPTFDWKLFRIVGWLFDPEPPDLTHLETQETTHGFHGYHFERDGYFEIRSEAIVTLTPTIDDVAGAAYTIASTGGVNKRIYLPFRADKGKVWKYALDSSVAFHLYEMKVRAKEWNGNEYNLVQPQFTDYQVWPVRPALTANRQP